MVVRATDGSERSDGQESIVVALHFNMQAWPQSGVADILSTRTRQVFVAPSCVFCSQAGADSWRGSGASSYEPSVPWPLSLRRKNEAAGDQWNISRKTPWKDIETNASFPIILAEVAETPASLQAKLWQLERALRFGPGLQQPVCCVVCLNADTPSFNLATTAARDSLKRLNTTFKIAQCDVFAIWTEYRNVYAEIRSAKEEIRSVKAAVHAEIQGVHAEIQGVKDEMRAEMQGVKDEMRAEMRAEMQHAKDEIISGVKDMLTALRRDLQR
ncbi:unnamed protein product [Symbiodinium microadriaticum]|nr:unnamed protein product [Symbiodinium microadriaticum]